MKTFDPTSPARESESYPGTEFQQPLRHVGAKAIPCRPRSRLQCAPHRAAFWRWPAIARGFPEENARQPTHRHICHEGSSALPRSAERFRLRVPERPSGKSACIVKRVPNNASFLNLCPFAKSQVASTMLTKGNG